MPEITAQSQIILTGAIGAGKSTYARKLLQQANLSVAGFVTEKVIEKNVTVGYTLHEIGGENHIFAHRNFTDKPQFAGFGIDLSVFDDFGYAILRRALQSGRFILIDELGVMEQNAQKLCATARAILAGNKPYLVVIQQRALDFWLSGIRHGKVVTVTEKDRVNLSENLCYFMKRY